MTFRADRVRLYFNRGREDKERVWSIDFGIESVEILASKVSLINLQVSTEYDATVLDPNKARAWMTINHPVGIHLLENGMVAITDISHI